MPLKILILCHDFPPMKSIGAQRPKAWFDYFTGKGEEVLIVSENELGINMKPEKSKGVFRILLRKIHSGLSLFVGWHISFLDKKRPILKKADSIAKNYNPDIIIATGEPFILFKYASLLSRKYNIPWIADYRDNWSNEPTLEFNALQIKIYQWYFGLLEKNIVQSSAAITTVGEPTANRIQKLFPNKKITIIPNGHNIPEDFKIQTVKKDGLKISYIGRLYKHRNPTLFLRGFLSWLNNNPNSNAELHFFGIADFQNQVTYLKSLVPEVNKHITIHKSYPYEQMLYKASDSNAFLMLADKSLPLTNGKLYDYLGLKRPIILCPDDKSIFNHFINAEESGFIADSEQDVFEILDQLNDHKGDNEFFTTNISRSEFSREKSSEKLFDLIKRLCAAS